MPHVLNQSTWIILQKITFSFIQNLANLSSQKKLVIWHTCGLVFNKLIEALYSYEADIEYLGRYRYYYPMKPTNKLSLFKIFSSNDLL